MTTYINVVSGKGGTGKTLLCSILAELLGNQNVSVLVIDMDIFVRGLTTLLYFQRSESLKLSTRRELTVSDIFYRRGKELNNKKDSLLATHKYRSFEIVPAVSRIDELFDLEREMIFDFEYNERVFDEIKNLIKEDKYDYVLFDCRAGYDNLVSTIHRRSDITICVQEEDDISDVTANNLIRQLEKDSSRKTIFRVTNKARNISSFKDLEQKGHKGIDSLGYIPFDIDVMNSFGKKSFWEDISRSLYKSAVAETWNKLAMKTELKHILFYKRYSPLLSEKVERTFGMIGQSQRLFAVLGLILGICGLLFPFFGREIIYMFGERPEFAFSFVISIMGFAMFLLSFLPKRKR